VETVVPMLAHQFLFPRKLTQCEANQASSIRNDRKDGDTDNSAAHP
jgi:hypothetical protein